MITAAELTAIPLFADLDRRAARVRRAARSKTSGSCPGEFAAREGDERALFLVVEGVMGLTKDINGVERRVGKRRPGEMYGEVPVMLSTNLPASYGAIEASRVLQARLRQLLRARRDGAAGRRDGRRVGPAAHRVPKELAAETAKPDMTVIGPSIDPRVHEIRTFLNRNRISYDDGRHAAIRRRRRAPRDTSDRFPVVELADGTVLVDPTVREIAARGRAAGGPDARRLRRDHHRRRTDRADRRRQRRGGGTAHARRRAIRAGRPGGHLDAHRELHRLPVRRLGRRARGQGDAPGAAARRRDHRHPRDRGHRSRCRTP